MVYLYIDGDNIGLKIEKSFLDNDESSLIEINNKVKTIVNRITEFLIFNKQEIIFSGADGIICKGPEIDIHSILDFIRGVDDQITFSIGSGLSLKDSYIALRYAKSLNKNVAVALIKNKFNVIGKA